MVDVAVAPEIQKAPPPPEAPKRVEAVPAKERFDLERKKVESDASQIRSALEKTVKEAPEVDLKPEQEQFGELSQELDNLNQETATELGLQEQPQLTREQQEKDQLEQYKDTEGRVEKIAVDKDVYFVHGTKPFSGAERNNNPLLKDNVTWQDKIAVIIEYAPTLSSSTIAKGEERDTFSPIGVILNSGRVEDVRDQDKGSFVKDLKTRTSWGGEPKTVEEYKYRLDNALRHRLTYNEFILGGDPKVAGIFLDVRYILKDTIYADAGMYKSLKLREVFESAGEFGMSVFIFKNGIAYESSLDPKTGQLIIGREIPPHEMLTRTYEIPAENKTKIQQQVKNSLRSGALPEAK